MRDLSEEELRLNRLHSGDSFETLSGAYRSGGRKPVAFDFQASGRRLLETDPTRSAGNAQYIHYYPGRLFPHIPRWVLTLGLAPGNEACLLDPFAGSGTILLEALVNPTVKWRALGVEINPLGRLISKVKTHFVDNVGLPDHMVKLRRACSGNASAFVPDYKNLSLWFSSAAVEKLARLRKAISTLDVQLDMKDFLWVCFSRAVRRVSKADPYIPPPVLLKPEKYRADSARHGKLVALLKTTEDPDVWGIFEACVQRNAARLLPFRSPSLYGTDRRTAEVIWDDARMIKRGKWAGCGRIDAHGARILADRSVDLVLTSPPYLTAQKYMRGSRLELLWLGFPMSEILAIDRASVGTERIRVATGVVPTGVPQVDALVERTRAKHEERGVMVQDYFAKMHVVLQEMHRVLKDKAYAVLVVGENRVLTKQANTHGLLSAVAETVGFRSELVLKDKIRGRTMLTKRNGTGGLIRHEYAIFLRKEA